MNNSPTSQPNTSTSSYFCCKAISKPCTITHCVNARLTKSSIAPPIPNDNYTNTDIVLLKGSYIEIHKFNKHSSNLSLIDETYLFSMPKSIAVLPYNSILNIKQQSSATATTTTTTSTTTSQVTPLSSVSSPSKPKLPLIKPIIKKKPDVFNANRFEMDPSSYIDDNFRNRDLLLVTSDSGYLSVLSWSEKYQQLVSVQQLRIAMPSSSTTTDNMYSTNELGKEIIVSSCFRIIAISAFKNNISIFPVQNETNNKYTIFSKKLDIKLSGLITSFGFIQSEATSNFIYLQITADSLNESKIYIYRYDCSNNTIQYVTKYVSNQIRPYKFIPIPTSTSQFYLATRDEKLVKMEFNESSSTLKPISIKQPKINDIDNSSFGVESELITSYLWLNDNNDKNSGKYLLLSSDNGSLIKVYNNEDSIQFIKEVNPIQHLLNLGDNHILLSGDICDGEIIKIEDLNIHSQQKIPNYSPILDLCIKPSNILRDVTSLLMCSGGGNTVGQLYTLENCLPQSFLGYIESEHSCTDIWNFQIHNSKSSLIVVGCERFAQITMVYKLNNLCTIDEYSKESNFILNESTVYSNYNEKGYIQCTFNRIRWISPTFNKFIDWQPSDNQLDIGHIINCSTRNSDILLFGSKSNDVIYLQFDHQKEKFNLISTRTFDQSLSTIEIPQSSLLKTCSQDEINTISNIFLVGTWDRSIHIVSMDSELKLLYSVNELSGIPHSIKLVRLGDRRDTHLKIVAGLKDGNLLRWEWDDLKQDPFKSPLYCKQFSRVHVQITCSSENKGALVTTAEKIYYLTFKKTQPIISKIAFDGVSNAILKPETNTIIFIRPQVGIGLLAIDISTNVLISPIRSDTDELNPRRVLYIKELNLNVILYDNYLVLRDIENRKTIFKYNHKLKEIRFLKYWESKKMIVYGGEFNKKSSTSSERGAIYLTNISMNPTTSEINGETNVLETPHTVCSMTPLEDSKFFISTEGDSKILDLNHLYEVGQIVPSMSSAVELEYQNNRLLEGTRRGIQIYRYTQEHNALSNISKIRYQEISMLTSSCLFLSPDEFAMVDIYGNLTILHDNQDLANENRNTPLDTIASFSIKESCSLLQRIDNNNLIVGGALGGIHLISKINNKKDYDFLLMLQYRLSEFKLTEPLLNNDHLSFRSEMSMILNILDGEMLAQFLWLPEEAQIRILTNITSSQNLQSRETVSINQLLNHTILLLETICEIPSPKGTPPSIQ